MDMRETNSKDALDFTLRVHLPEFIQVSHRVATKDEQNFFLKGYQEKQGALSRD